MIYGIVVVAFVLGMIVGAIIMLAAMWWQVLEGDIRG